ncbi:MAG: aromatic ring-hydroxylating dioxygenase subunit alpha [Gammaproteobacteria bacterium]|nr:aromatic ring-hydroxylating dioxygenase subunit alpha [Gammaproteobacteria bacterium]
MNGVSAPAPVTSLPARYFTDPQVFARARENIFFRTWQYACHAGEVANAGDFVAFTLFDQDLFVMRGDDGAIGAFYNVCRHRGHKLLEGSGNRRAIICPYHAWRYDRAGKLRAAPHSDAVAGFARENIALHRVRVEEFLGFVFVNLDADAKPLGECYPGVREALLELCPRIDSMLPAHEFSANEECNWLIAVENYNECYHCKTAHPDFADGVIDAASYSIAPFGGGRCLRHRARANAGGNAWYPMSGKKYGSFYLWPATAIQVYPGGVLNAYCWRPLGVDETEVRRLWFSPDGAVDAELQKLIALDRDRTFAEDLQLVKNVQRGVRSRGFAPGPLIINPDGGIDDESPVAALHEWMRAAVD